MIQSGSQPYYIKPAALDHLFLSFASVFINSNFSSAQGYLVDDTLVVTTPS